MPPLRRPVAIEADPEWDGITARDYVMARCAAAIAALDSAKAQVIDAVAMFVTPDDDRKGKERKKGLDEAIETASIATRSLEDAMSVIDDVDMEACEPWEEDDDDPETAS